MAAAGTWKLLTCGNWVFLKHIGMIDSVILIKMNTLAEKKNKLESLYNQLKLMRESHKEQLNKVSGIEFQELEFKLLKTEEIPLAEELQNLQKEIWNEENKKMD
ncbi:MAG: hypothetical protein IPM82_03270 [Saprospiraceae bacterium]|nr:hypothetical protein [Saprospiraceae bacterium]